MRVVSAGDCRPEAPEDDINITLTSHEVLCFLHRPVHPGTVASCHHICSRLRERVSGRYQSWICIKRTLFRVDGGSFGELDAHTQTLLSLCGVYFS